MIIIKDQRAIEAMRIAGRLTGQVLTAVTDIIRPGISTADIDAFCEDYIINTLAARPASKGQYGYLYSVNTSPNHVICHGMPSPSEFLKKGDIVNVDVTVEKGGYIGDSSKMFCVGAVSDHARRLVDVTQQALYKSIRQVKPGATLGDIGHAIQQFAESNHYSVVQEFCGHGIGQKMHEDPQVLHYGRAGTGVKLLPGMIFTIEPMLNQGTRHIKQHKDGWTVTTKDKRLSAQWEHTILVTESGFEILTLREDEEFSPSR
ncbi:MAG: methionyl aminopeptidase [Oceanicoccus sp.]